MKYILLVILLCFATISNAQLDLKKHVKFSTFYAAVNGGNSISDIDVFSVTNGLETTTIKTPFDYNMVFGVRKIARFGYENKANTFYDGSEESYSDAATVGKITGLEYLFEVDINRQQGIDYLDQQHFIRYVRDKWTAKVEYVKNGFADVKYFESSQRYRQKIGDKFSINFGAVQRLSEPYGFDPLEEWVLSTGDIHYTYLAIQEGYNIDVNNSEYKNPNGDVVATNVEVWEEVVIPQMLSEYVDKKRNDLPNQWVHSFVIGYDFYHYTKSFWLHSWANLMPYHYNDGGQYSYHVFNNDEQWYDYSGGMIFGHKLNKNLGVFIEGKYNKYWNRKWYDFKFGINYIIL